MTPIAPKNELRIWIVLHTSLIAIIPIVFAVMSSCIKKPELTDATLGSAFEMSEINAVLSEALAEASPYAATEDQAVHFLVGVRIETEAVQYYQEIIQEVQAIIDTPQEFTLVVDQTVIELNGEDPPVVRETTESELQYAPRPQLAMLYVPEELGGQKIKNLSPEIYQIANRQKIVPYADREYIKQTFHNLKVSQFTMPAPPGAQARPDCAGLPDCQMRVTQLEFEVANWYSEAEFDKTIYQWQVSPDVPFLGRFVSDCTTAQQFISDRDYVVRNCSTLHDFVY